MYCTPQTWGRKACWGWEASGGKWGKIFRVPRVFGAEWVYLAPSSLPPSPSLPSSSSTPLLPLALCALSPLLPLLSPGHSALVSTHNGRSVLTLLTLHSACAPRSGHGRGRERGPGGRVKGWQLLTPCDQNAIKYQLPPPLFQRQSSNFTPPYRWPKLVPAGLVGTVKNKTSTSLAKQTNRCLLWLTGDVESCLRPACFSVCPATCVFSSSLCCWAHILNGILRPGLRTFLSEN